MYYRIKIVKIGVIRFHKESVEIKQEDKRRTKYFAVKELIANFVNEDTERKCGIKRILTLDFLSSPP